MPSLDFKGKNYVYSHHLSVPFRDLKIDTKKSKPAKGEKPNMDDNLIIQGDNLHALKALLPRYAGKIKCIYIDPPYNTGNEGWCYNDKVNSPLMREWLEDNANPVDKDDLERHDKWLCMMWPRLQLLRELLADDGVIFISINDIEVHNLRLLLDEIFGEENFVSNLPTIMNLKGNQDAYAFSDTHEHTLVYTKSITGCSFNYFNIDEDELDSWKEDEYGLYKQADGLRATGVNAPRKKRPNLWYPIYINEDGTDFYVTEDNKPKNKNDLTLLPINDSGEELSWYWSKNKVNNEKHNLILKKIKNYYSIYKKQRPKLGDIPTKKPKSIFYKAEYSTSSATNLLKQIFGKKLFDYTKPVFLIKDLMHLVTNKDDLVLDSFAGSGTTAHAVLALNKEDGGNRKFILVEMEDYANDITAERVRRVIDGVPSAKDENLKNGLGGSFTYCDLGEAFDVDKILTGESLPKYTALASYVFYTVTGQSLEKEAKQNTNFFIGETDLFEVYLVYKNDLSYLRHNDSALNQEKLDIIAAHNPKSTKQKIVFATAKYMSQDALKPHNIVFCQIPYAIHKIAGN
jgi:adenine-specific DNA-methyltransferase